MAGQPARQGGGKVEMSSSPSSVNQTGRTEKAVEIGVVPPTAAARGAGHPPHPLEGVESVDRSKLHLGNNASVAKIAENSIRPYPVFWSSFLSPGRERRKGVGTKCFWTF